MSKFDLESVCFSFILLFCVLLDMIFNNQLPSTLSFTNVFPMTINSNPLSFHLNATEVMYVVKIIEYPLMK